MAQQTNIGKAFPLESLGSDIARNEFNYQSILTGLIEWDKTNSNDVIIRLAKDTAPWFEDFIIPSKKSVFDLNAYKSNALATPSGRFSVDSLLDVAYYGGTDGEPSDPGDEVTLRVAIDNHGEGSWRSYYSHLIPTCASGGDYRIGNYVSQGNVWYRVLNTITNSTTAPSADIVNFIRFDVDWVQGSSYDYRDIIRFNNALYIANVNISSSDLTPVTSDEFDVYAPDWVSGTAYVAGDYVAYTDGGETLAYLAVNDITDTDTTPISDPVNWVPKRLSENTVGGEFSQSNIIRWTAHVDLDGILLRNVSTLDSTNETNIMLQSSIKTQEPASIYQRSTGVHSTVNYVSWPNNPAPVWQKNETINPSDSSLSISSRQPYSASMIFDHTNPETAKTFNFINYDGPDLDQGLCIYLPVGSDVGNAGVAVPEDGFTYEFYIRIWPDVNYTNASTRDHIVNKAQVYVYSAPDSDSAENSTCGTPIAKFSMARMTNYYMFGENVSIPDKPVVYRATFAYSSALNQWTVLDYYQLPDHVFMGPIGFVDPQNPGNLDLNSSEIGGINPSASFVGYETGAFPTFADVFSNPDLSPYRPDSIEDFVNRSI
jgi:hypothetical protein